MPGVMEVIILLPIMFAAGLALVGLVLLVLLIRLFKGSEAGRRLSADEAQLLEETWRQLEKIDERLTNLETILMQPRGLGEGAER